MNLLIFRPLKKDHEKERLMTEDTQKEMSKILHNKRMWLMWADGNYSCPICGATVAPSYTSTHILWHEKLKA